MVTVLADSWDLREEMALGQLPRFLRGVFHRTLIASCESIIIKA